MLVNKTMQKNTGLKAEDLAKIEIESDTEPRTLKVPEDLQESLKSQPLAEKAFAKYSYSHQKEWLDWIGDARKPETRRRRIEIVIQKLMEKSRD